MKKIESYADLFKDDGLFEIEIENNNNSEKLPIELFQKIEVELLDSLVNTDSDDETGGLINFIKQVVESVREEFDSAVEEEDKKTFIHLLTKILAALLSVKADSIENITKLVKLTVSTIIRKWSEPNYKKMVRTKLVPKRITQWLPKQPYT